MGDVTTPVLSSHPTKRPRRRQPFRRASYNINNCDSCDSCDGEGCRLCSGGTTALTSVIPIRIEDYSDDVVDADVDSDDEDDSVSSCSSTSDASTVTITDSDDVNDTDEEEVRGGGERGGGGGGGGGNNDDVNEDNDKKSSKLHKKCEEDDNNNNITNKDTHSENITTSKSKVKQIENNITVGENISAKNNVETKSQNDVDVDTKDDQHTIAEKKMKLSRSSHRRHNNISSSSSSDQCRDYAGSFATNRRDDARRHADYTKIISSRSNVTDRTKDDVGVSSALDNDKSSPSLTAVTQHAQAQGRRVHNNMDFEEEEEDDEEDHSSSFKHGLIRKAAVRRKGYNWSSKSLPKNNECRLKVDNYVRRGTSLETGSSLELAPSLLNIYDGIASSASPASGTSGSDIRHSPPTGSHSSFPNRHVTTGAASFSPPSFSHNSRSPPQPSSLCLSRGSSPTKSPPTTSPRSPCSPNSPTTAMPRVPYRNAKLPSLSEPMDRPVSLMDAETSSRLLQSGSKHYTGDSKKRPLSISSASSASSTSPLPVTRIKRQTGNSLDYSSSQGQNESVCGKTGCSCNTKLAMSPDGDAKHRVMCSRIVSESHSSMDSGCVENDHNGFRCFDDMSLASSSEAGSLRDDMSSGIQDFVDTSQSSLGMETTDSFQSTPSFHATSRGDSFISNSSNASTPGNDSTTRGNEGFVSHDETQSRSPPDEESDIIKRMGSYIVRNSPKLGVSSRTPETSTPNDCSNVRAIDERRRLNSVTRNEARKNFFSNYEERYSRLYSYSRKSKEDPDYAEIDDATPPTTPTSPTAPTHDFDLPAITTTHNNGIESVSKEVITPPSNDVMAVSVASTTVASTPTSPSSPSSSSFSSSSHALRRASSSRSSRRSGKSGEATSTPSSPVYVSYVQRVVAEIVDSERTYISSLEDIIFGYLEPLEGMLNMEAAKDDIVCLFSNIREIYQFGKIFLADLELTSNDPIKVAECFVRHNKGFVIYTEYCTNYPCAVEVLTRFMQHSELSELCKERQMALGHGLPLGAYLLKPVQRVLKYHLLLQNIMKSYEKDKKEVPVLKQAFQHMTEMAHHINEMKRKHEHAVRIQEIQSQLEDYAGEDLTRLGELVLESTFRVYGAKASRQVFLFERGLLISKKKEGGMLSCKTFIKCSNLMLVEVIPNEPLSFHAIPFNNPRAQYTLQARNMEQKRRWCQEMKRLILESFKGRIPDNVKGLVMELGREHDDDYVTKESLDAVRKHQHTAPEYLEKRRVRRKSGSRMPDFSFLKPSKAKKTAQRKDDKPNSRFFLDPGGRRAESKSPEAHRRLFSKLMVSQARSQSHSLPSTPLSENSSMADLVYATKNTTMLSATQPSSPEQIPNLPSTPSTTPDTPTPVSDLNSPTTPNDKYPPNTTHSDNNNKSQPPVVVKHAISRQAAVKKHSKTSKSPEINRKNQEGLKDHIKPHRSHHHNGRGSVISDEEDDDYVRIREDDSNNISSPTSCSMEELITPDKDDRHICNASMSHDNRTSESHKYNEKSDTRSSSLPSLLDDSCEDIQSEFSNNQCHQSIDEINHTQTARGRMSRRDLQNASGGRPNRKQPTQNKHCNNKSSQHEGIQSNTVDVETLKTMNSDERLAYEKNLVLNKALRIPNTSQYLNIPAHKMGKQKELGKATLTNWNSTEKLTNGSMTDLSHIHEDPWIVNSDTSVSPLVSSTENLASSPSSHHLASSPNGDDDIFKNKENLDWLVYLKRNCLESHPVSFVHKPKRMSTSALERSASMKNYTTSKRRISDQTGQSLSPSRHHNMTRDSFHRSGHSPNGSNSRDRDNAYNNLDSTHSKHEHVDNNDYNTFPRKQSVVKGITIKAQRPYSLDLDSVPDENQLRDESNRIVAEMEDYISNASSSENILVSNKFPTTLPTINVEKHTDDTHAATEDDKRLSTVSSGSTSSYDSTSSDGMVGTLKSKLNTWAKQMAKKDEDSEHSYGSTVSSDEDEEDNNIEEDDKTLTSTPKPKNSFEPPANQRKSVQEERKLETVLREYVLGSESLGSRMAQCAAAMVEPCKSMPQLPPPTNTISNDGNVQKHCHTGADSPVFPDNSRFSLPATKEAAEALSLDNCDIRQSDSGFSLQSNDSTLSDVTENIVRLEPRTEEVFETHEKYYETKMSVILKPKAPMPLPVSEEKQKSPKLSRHNSAESVDSTDSFYERRLSIILNSEEMKEGLTIVNVYDDTNASNSKPESPIPIPRRKSIRDYVQYLEETTRPQSPKVTGVRKREPGAIIRQRLESLNKNMNYGRSKTCDPIYSRHVSDHREFTRSKSQPPSQYKYKLSDGPSGKPKCSDDTTVITKGTYINGNSDSYKSIERVNSFSNKAIKPPLLSRAKDSFTLSKSKECLNNFAKSKERASKSKDSLNCLTKSKEYAGLSKSKDSLNSNTQSTPSRSSTPSGVYHSNTPGHENWIGRFDEECSQSNTSNQFVYHAKQETAHHDESNHQQTSSQEGVDADNQPSENMVEQQSNEVDNLVIMKGWVQTLISKFQDK